MKNLTIPLFLLALSWIPHSFAQLAVPNAEGLTYGHVHLNVSDAALHQKLWVDLFDAEIVQKGPLTAIKFPNMIILLRENPPTVGSRETVMDHFGFKVRDIEDFLAKWRAAGYEVESEFIGAEGQKNAYVMMPDDVYVELQEDQSLHVEVMGRGVAWLATGTHESLMEASQFIEVIQRRQGLKVSCPEEIAYRAGYIDADQVRQQAQNLDKNEYGRYLLLMLDQEGA